MCFFTDPGFIGAISGSALTGVISYFIFEQQNKKQQHQEQLRYLIQCKANIDCEIIKINYAIQAVYFSSYQYYLTHSYWTNVIAGAYQKHQVFSSSAALTALKNTELLLEKLNLSIEKYLIRKAELIKYLSEFNSWDKNSRPLTVYIEPLDTFTFNKYNEIEHYSPDDIYELFYNQKYDIEIIDYITKEFKEKILDKIIETCDKIIQNKQLA